MLRCGQNGPRGASMPHVPMGPAAKCKSLLQKLVAQMVAIDNRIDREHFEGVVATAIESTKDGVHYEVERLSKSAVKNVEKKDVPRPVEVPKPEVKSSKRAGMEMHVRAVLQIVENIYPWLYAEMLTEIQKMFESKEEFEKSFGESAPLVPQGDMFEAEHYIEATKEKQLVEEISEKLTQYAHMLANESLAVLREREATMKEHTEEHDKAKNDAVKLKQTHIVIEK